MEAAEAVLKTKQRSCPLRQVRGQRTGSELCDFGQVPDLSEPQRPPLQHRGSKDVMNTRNGTVWWGLSEWVLVPRVSAV